MGRTGVILLVLGQMATGLLVIAFAGDAVCRALSRKARLAYAYLAGMGAQSLAILLLAFEGVPLSGWWWSGMCAASVAMLVLCPSLLRRVVAPSPPHASRATSPPLALLFAAALLALVSWAAIAAFTLPVMDYDGIVIWWHRVRVLFAERTLVTPSLRDPLRYVAQPLHPYLLPVLETGYCIAFGGAVSAAQKTPHLLCYGAYLVVAADALGRFADNWRRTAGAAALLLLPAMATASTFLSAREPFMAVYAFAAVVCLFLWVETEADGFVALGAFFALLCQQTKIEGLPVAVGWVGGAALCAVAFETRRQRRLAALLATLPVFLLAVPWRLARGAIPAVNIDPFMADYASILSISATNVLSVAGVVARELLFRPELYGLGAFVALAGLASGWTRGNTLRRLALLLAPAAVLGAVVLVYALRQDQLPAARNASITRRLIVVFPALVFACLAAPSERKRIEQAALPPLIGR